MNDVFTCLCFRYPVTTQAHGKGDFIFSFLRSCWCLLHASPQSAVMFTLASYLRTKLDFHFFKFSLQFPQDDDNLITRLPGSVW